MVKTEYLKLSNLKLHPNNPRTIKDESFKTLCKSIKDNSEYFEARPIICSKRTGENIIIAGNQRYRAAKKIGLKEVPAVILPKLTEAKEKEIMIRDNISNGEWNMDLLANDFEIEDLKDWGVDLPDFNLDKKEIEPTIDNEFCILKIDFENGKELKKAFDKFTKEGYKCEIII